MSKAQKYTLIISAIFIICLIVAGIIAYETWDPLSIYYHAATPDIWKFLISHQK